MVPHASEEECDPWRINYLVTKTDLGRQRTICRGVSADAHVFTSLATPSTAAKAQRAAALSEGTQWCKGGTGKAEAAKLQDAGISPSSARENEWQKKGGLLNWEDLCDGRAEASGQLRRNTKGACVVFMSFPGRKTESQFGWLGDVEHHRSIANVVRRVS